ncbi:multi-copper polyphenol oxidoreductase [Pseudoxanthomonas suwonensis]|nr:peptidoglycan editing factor PgeF [Pseudoxanthomonas suwonensis]KAF1698834.1 multi-copper polyphenol oxidoreductase [Pseudoxanthomonas suwonensis]
MAEAGIEAAEDAVLPADWPPPPGVRAFTSLRHGAGVSRPPFDCFNLGARNGDDPDAVAANREELRRRLQLPSHPYWLRQVHGTAVLRLDAPLARPRPADQEPAADAAVTSVPGAVAAILTADCLPVVFAAGDGSEVGAAHAGWRGLAAGVLEATVAAMRTPPHALRAWLGPAAGPRAYEIGSEVHDAFVGQDPAAAAAFAPTRPGRWKVDLYALARLRLRAAGLAADAIHGGGLCTISDPARFYSHRRDQRTGRLATLVFIEPAA